MTGADETAVRVKGKKTIVGVVTDALTGQTLGMDALVERDSDGFAGWLLDCVSGFGVETIVADDLPEYKPDVNRLGIDHQICAARVKKWAWNRLDKIDGWERVKDKIWRLLTQFPIDGDTGLGLGGGLGSAGTDWTCRSRSRRYAVSFFGGSRAL